MTGEIRQALGEHLSEDQVEPIANILKAAASYAEGDALAGVKLANLTPEDYETITRVFRDAGFDVSFNNRMSLVSFVSSPETDDKALNEAIANL